MNLVDKILLEVAPGVAARRIQQKQVALLRDSQVRRYEGGGNGRRFDSFLQGKGSANQEINRDIGNLRERGRYLFQNTPFGKRATRTIANNVVGTGILPNPQSANAAFVQKAKAAWTAWADKTTCDWDGNFSFYGLQKLVMKTVDISGECIALRRDVKVTPENALGLEIQLLEPEYLDGSKNSEATAGGGWIQNGIEYDSDGKRKFYWIFNRHPLESSTAVSKPIPVDQIAHIYEVDRPGQHHGVPGAAAVTLKTKDLDDYEDFEVMNKKLGNAYAGFITSTDPAAMENADPDDYDDLGNAKLEPATMYKLLPGEQITFATPPISPQFSDFVRTHRQAIAAGRGVTYEQMTNDYSNVNFSSGRMGWIEFSRNVDDWQWTMLVPMFCDRVYGWFLQKLLVANSVKALPADLIVQWTPPRREMIDPVKETQAITLGIAAGLTSWQEAVREQGYNPDEVFAQIKADYERFKKAGIPATFNPGLDPKINGQQSGDK